MSFEDDEFKKIYEYSEWVRNTERSEIDGEETIVLRPGFDVLRPLLVSMEAMARDIERNKDIVGFEIKRNKLGKTVFVATPFGQRYYNSLKAFHQHYAFDERYVYSPHVWAVDKGLEVVGPHPFSFKFGEPDARDRASGKTGAEAFNEVVSKVAEILASSTFKERLRVRKRSAKRNEEKGLVIEQKVFANKSRQLVLMLHFGYQEQYRAKITFEECQKHRKKFFNNCRSNKLLRGIVDYIWKLEEGDESGLHLHILIFYSAESCRDVYIARQIGEYWVKVTEGKGQYWNSNANKAFHAKYGHGIGTGEINWNDEAKREALRKNIRYMTKADQFLKMKYGKNCHLFGTSEVAEKKRSGRPRSIQPMLDGDAAGKTLTDSHEAASFDEMSPDAEQNE